jgi:hypothetical protein
MLYSIYLGQLDVYMPLNSSLGKKITWKVNGWGKIKILWDRAWIFTFIIVEFARDIEQKAWIL